ncbi:MAG: polysaccharide biosynthesis/export family protein [Bacteroidota bacterium]
MTTKTLQFILLCTLVAAEFAIAQSLDNKDDLQVNKNGTYQVPGQQKISPKSFVPEEIKEQTPTIPIMDGPVDPKEYVVGPGDIFSVNVWITPPLNLQLPVTPEGTIIIPTVGEIYVAGLRLEDAKKKVVSEIKKRYISSEASFTLFTPRLVMVAVKGVVWNEGSVFLQSTERVEAAIVMANRHEKISPPPYPQIDEQPRRLTSNINLIPGQDTIGSRRKILVRHRDGTTSHVDLEKYFLQRDPKLNPYLRDGDVVVVPKREIVRDFIGIYGGVNKEGVVEFVEGDSLFEMTKIARGLTVFADSEHVEIERSDDEGRFTQTITANLSAIASGASSDIPLQRGDRIIVREKPSLRRDYKIYVEGEVLYPGFYPITRDSTLISEIVHEAGGFTPEASMESSSLFRTSLSEKDIYTERIAIEAGLPSQEDTAYFKAENEMRLAREQVPVDFVNLFVSQDKAKDVFLRDGDHLIIGSKTKTVYVFGQVVHPGHISFVKDQGYSYYTEKAGGLTDHAVRGDIRVLKANTREWLSPGETTIEEGDYIWVPSVPYRPLEYYLLSYSQVFSIVGTVGTLTLLFLQLKK